jgi:hypothetical protein
VVALLDGKGVGLVLKVSREDVLREADEVGGGLEDEREQRQPDEHLCVCTQRETTSSVPLH